MAKLKPCPFCGEIPHIICNKYRHDETSYLIKCSNNDCRVIPATYESGSVDTALFCWNERAKK